MNKALLSRQAGLSMVELLIAMAISSFLILGITQIFIDNKRNYVFQQNQSANQENSRFSLMLLEQQLYRAGFRQLAQDSWEISFPSIGAGNGCPAFKAGQTILPTTNQLGVCLRYQRATVAELDCQGNLIPNDAPIKVRIEKDPANGDLNCYVNGGPKATLITGLNQVAFEYGVDLPPKKRLVDAYLPASAVLPAHDILSVRYATLHESDSSTVALTADSYNFPLSSTTAVTPTDHKLYKSAQGTTTLRNIAP